MQFIWKIHIHINFINIMCNTGKCKSKQTIYKWTLSCENPNFGQVGKRYSEFWLIVNKPWEGGSCMSVIKFHNILKYSSSNLSWQVVDLWDLSGFSCRRMIGQLLLNAMINILKSILRTRIFLFKSEDRWIKHVKCEN